MAREPERALTQYEHCLHAMQRLLEAVRELHWAGWIRDDIAKWRSACDTSHHLSAYGGMGSFNDLFIRQVNNHSIPLEQEPWANELFDCLRALCYFLAKDPERFYTADALAGAIGKHDAGLAGFVRGKTGPSNIHGYAHEQLVLRGLRCLRCGYGETSRSDIEAFIAQCLVPAKVSQSCEHLTLDKLVDAILRWDIPNLEDSREAIAVAVAASGIAIADRNDGMSPCPNGDVEMMAYYRWRPVGNDVGRFEPSNDNLPMRD
jgi:hypothetical protein